MAGTMTRREALVALAGGMGLLLGPSKAAESFSISPRGCIVNSDSVATLAAQRRFSQFGRPKNVAWTTGGPDLDRMLGRAVNRIKELFSQDPGVGFYDDVDEDGGPNALATNGTLLDGTWGTVLFGRELFSDLMRRDEQGWGVLMVMAHEVGHIAQFRTAGVLQRLRPRQAATVKHLELHADLLAGYFLGVRKREQPSIRLGNAAEELYRRGDYDFNDEHHHGTPEERIEVAQKGFAMGHGSRATFDQVFSRGVEYVLGHY